ncbi:hypothetical protein AB990_03505 [Alkalihalobacillus pseudalcaliphilus]|nr:hypothetical protein AB990_03505 [Alkalihalobacillus pseudalcaliphilus]
MLEVIQLKDVRKTYGELIAVERVSLSIRKGEVFGVLGHNGAGKTTLLEMMEGVHQPDQGEVKVMGMDALTSRAFKEKIGVQLQATSLHHHLKVKELLRLFASFYKEALPIEELVKEFELAPLLNQYFKRLSGGQKQKVSLAIAVIHNPNIVFLDEPSTGLDPGIRHIVWKYIQNFKKQGKTVVITTHYMEEAESLCDRVALIEKGKVLTVDTPKEIINGLNIQSRVIFIRPENLDVGKLTEVSGLTFKHTGDSIEVKTNDVEKVIQRLYRWSEEQNWQIEGLRIEHGSLNDYFKSH